MKCPLFELGRILKGYSGDSTEGNCIKERCAWWNEHFGMCSMAVDARLKATEDRLRERGMPTKNR